MNYSETIDFLFNKTLIFQHVGAAAYKPGLETTEAISALFGNPDRNFKKIHVGGTNGKGSTSHLLASILQKSGYKVGLYTSPHLLDFRERIRVNGEMIDKESVISFVDKFLKSDYKGRSASFFELTTIMAFNYFSKQKVDYAIIEVGLGGRLDSTNIITPDLSIITNISLDHTQFLGATTAAIAGEKAGIIKKDVPVVIGEYLEDTKPVFAKKAESVGTKITFAQDNNKIISSTNQNHQLILQTSDYGEIVDELSGYCQVHNANTVLNAVSILKAQGVSITDKAVKEGFATVCETTGLMGRWMKVGDQPTTICDTGHNTGGIQYIAKQLSEEKYNTLRIVMGFVSDKDVNHILEMLPHNAVYYFTQASVERAMDVDTLVEKAQSKGITGKAFKTVAEAYRTAQKESAPDDFIYIGGSTFIVADFLSVINE